MKRLSLLALLLWILYPADAQTFTMSNNCTKMLQQLDYYNQGQMYDSAVAYYPVFSKKCTAKDAKFKGGTSLAHAYNGLEQYSEALNASNMAIKANKTWIAAYFERAVAYAGLDQIAESKADFQRIVDLSAKNQDQDSRAGIFAMLANISFIQGETDSAFLQIDQAIANDKRPEFFIQKGDMLYKMEDYEKAFEQYDRAVDAGKNDLQMYSIRSAQRLRIYQKKYGTENVTQLSQKMTAEEKGLCCKELTKLRSFGVKNLKLDMTYTFLCE